MSYEELIDSEKKSNPYEAYKLLEKILSEVKGINAGLMMNKIPEAPLTAMLMNKIIEYDPNTKTLVHYSRGDRENALSVEVDDNFIKLSTLMNRVIAELRSMGAGVGADG